MSLVETRLDDDGIAVVTLNDPGRRNALNEEMVGDIIAAFDYLEADGDTRAVIITGAPPAFCAGADLRHLANASQTSLRGIYEGFLRVARTPFPTIAAVNGAAVGAGVNMALAADVILCAESAVIDTGFLRLALHPGGGHTYLMRNLVGAQATAAMVMFGERIDGPTAEKIGFAWRCVPDGELTDAAMAMARRAAAAPTELQRRVKESIELMRLIESHEKAVDHELMEQIWSAGTDDFRSRLADLQSKISS